MDRKDFLKKSGCGMLCFSAAPLLVQNANAQGSLPVQERKSFKIDIEIYEAREDSWCHKKVDKF